MDFDSSGSNGSVQSRESLQALFLPAGVREELLPVRMASWSRRVASVHPETLRSPQQLRAFCTVTFVLFELGSERSRLRRLKVRPDALWSSSTTRCYTKDAPLLYRSRTAYYDVLRVSPGATQSQIKTAYYKQSLIYHPDKNPGSKDATQRFSEISEAYTVLGNVGLRRKYDRGILSHSDVQGAGRPSSRPTQHQQQHQHRARRFSQSGGKAMFDFDAFYQAHYGEQLQREQAMRARKQRLEEEQKKNYERWRRGKMMEMTVAMLLAMAGAILFNLSRS